MLNLIHTFYRLATKPIRICQRLLGAATVGVRAIILNEKNEILLVKHTYRPYWYLPGGGVKNGETAKDAIIREIKEEAGIVVTATPVLMGIYFHVYLGVNDYPVLYLVKDYIVVDANSREIAEVRWFDYSALPADISPATKRRLDEYFLNLEPVDLW